MRFSLIYCDVCVTIYSVKVGVLPNLPTGRVMTDYESILNKHRFKYKKAFGQNFIFDDALLDEIAEAGGADNAAVVEIGAGAGTLSRAIAKRCRRLCAFEIDETLFPVLDETLGEFDNVQLFSNNVLELGVETVDMLIGEEYVVIANLPYYITTPLISLFLKSEKCGSITCLVQKEVAERICATDGGDYGALSACVQAVAKPRLVRVVKSWEFNPMPEVDSALIRLDKVAGAALDDKTDAFLKACFAQKRKTLVNNLTAYGISKDDAVTALASIEQPLSARAEQLGTEKLLALARQLIRT